MSLRRGHPAALLAAQLLAISAVVALALVLLPSVRLSDRDAEYFWARHWWQSAFDALSVTTGVGMVTRSFAEDYTQVGVWVLAVGGVLGAICYLRQLARALESVFHVKHVWRAIGLTTVVGCACGLWLGVRSVSAANGVAQGLAAAFGVGLSIPEVVRSAPAFGPLVVIGAVAAVGGLALPLIRQFLRVRDVRRTICAALVCWLVSMIATAAMVAYFERPSVAPGSAARSSDVDRAFSRTLGGTFAVGTAGVDLLAIDRDSAEGVKLALGAVVLVGGIGGSAVGGVGGVWLLLAIGSLVLRSSNATGPGSAGRGKTDTERGQSLLQSGAISRSALLRAGTAVTLAMLLLTSVTVAGLLVLEHSTRSPFEPAATLGDAWLDGAAVVAGANVSSGLYARVIDPHLSSGIRQDADKYQYGMIWLMLAMFCGRVLPVALLARHLRR